MGVLSYPPFFDVKCPTAFPIFASVNTYLISAIGGVHFTVMSVVAAVPPQSMSESSPAVTSRLLNWSTLKWMNLPVGELIVAPVENAASGVLVCDTAIGGIGKLRESVTIEVKDGKALNVISKDKTALRRVNAALATDEWSSVIGEFAFGLNPHARICNEFLETEKIKGTCHIAFGNNSDFPGGRNPSSNHMDFLITKPTVNVIMKNGDKLRILTSGRFKL